jgi:hypothetical protein
MPDRSAGQSRPDSLTLQQPVKIYVVPDMNPNRQWFINYIFWQGAADSMATFIHQPDTTGWRAPDSPTEQDSLSVPITTGVHTGSIDRTVSFRALEGGRVGQAGRIRLRYEIVTQENFSRIIDVGSGYVADEEIPCFFVNELNGDTLDLGMNLQFGPGLVDSNGIFVVGLEDFEGFHAWRALESDGSDMTILAELSKQEEAVGEPIDSLYFNEIIPSLRKSGFYVFPFPVPGLGNVLDITAIHPNGRLGPNEFAWFDLNAFNGFTYYYSVTSFDRDYNIASHSQGLFKFDNCPVTQGLPYPCASDTTLIVVNADVTAQDNLKEVYVVPNPYRTGSSQFTTPNYHNFSDNKVRFVNVPSDCRLRIYTVAGDFIHEITNSGGVGNMEWDTRNASGGLVGSGAYIFRCENKSGEGVFGRLIIIR